MIRWPWRRLWRPDPPAETMPDTDIDAARRARRRVEHVWRAAREQRAEVASLAATLRGIREENHLLEIFQASIRERGPDD